MIHNLALLNAPPASGSVYDFIVVGENVYTKGCIVAGSLSSNSNVTVLLLEAGSPLSIISDMMAALYNFNYNWGYLTPPQRNSAFGLHQRRIFYPRCKILGGSQAINNGLCSQVNSQNYDSWTIDYSATGGSYQNVLPYFLQSENNTGPAIVAGCNLQLIQTFTRHMAQWR